MDLPRRPSEKSDQEAELARLRARIAELETVLHAQHARTNAIVARTQERVYWLDRWHLDLNALMARPGADLFRRSLRAARSVVRRAKKVKRRIVR